MKVAKRNIRVQMLESKDVENSPGSVIRYAAGEFYILPEKIAVEWIENGVAIDPDAPVIVEEIKEEDGDE